MPSQSIVRHCKTCLACLLGTDEEAGVSTSQPAQPGHRRKYKYAAQKIFVFGTQTSNQVSRAQRGA